MSQNSYALLDSGGGRKLEKFGAYTLDRPCAQAVWKPVLPTSEWDVADAVFSRENGNQWTFKKHMPKNWTACIDGLEFKLEATDFGHVGIFPEHLRSWRWMRDNLPNPRELRVLNLFAYSGGATLAAARLGCQVCHLDASKKMVSWARENAELNHLGDAPIRWITDDVQKFLKREKRRQSLYDGIILDPPSFGRGKRQELFKIDDHLLELLAMCRDILVPDPSFVFFSCHTPGYTPLVLQHLLNQGMSGCKGGITTGEMTLEGGSQVLPVPSGTYAIWHR